MEDKKGRTVYLKNQGDILPYALPGVYVRGAIRTVSYYRSAYELLEAETVLPDMEEDFCDFLRSFDDYEGIGYLCLNGEVVLFCDDVNGNVCSASKIGDVLPSIMQQYAEYYA